MAKPEKKKAKRAKAKSAKAPVITLQMLASSRRRPGYVAPEFVFTRPPAPPGSVPSTTPGSSTLAMDASIGDLNSWAAGQVIPGFINGSTFLGYPTLSILATLPEYRRMAEVLATECTRNWIKIKSTSDDDGAQGKIAEIEAEWRRMDVRGAIRRAIEIDAFFGRAHLYIDTGQTDDRDELINSIGNGLLGSDGKLNPETALKFKGKRSFLRGVKPVEPIWCYPAQYNAIDPLKDDWYNPQTWFVQGKELHKTRILRFVGREVPDLLKPTYMFGGVSLSQLLMPYVDRWSETVQAVADLVKSFSVMGLKTDLSTSIAPGGGDGLSARLELFNNYRTNQGVMALQKGAEGQAEEFFNVSTPLGTLDALMAQMQEHLCSISGEPVVKLLGIQPAGLNASSQGELSAWYEWVAAFQPKFVGQHLETILAFTQLSLWGQVDPDITYEWEPIEELNAKEEAELRKLEAETAQIYIEAGVLAPEDERDRLESDPTSLYSGLSLSEPETDEFGEEGDGEAGAPNLSEMGGQASATTPREDRLERGRSRQDHEIRVREPRAREGGVRERA